MSRPSLLLALPLLVGLCPPLMAQESSSLTRGPDLAERRLPLHSCAWDPAYGTWAAGPGYKASFHDGFVFYPLLGDAAPENLPLRWTTTAVRLGDRNLLSSAAPTHRQLGDWRYEIDFGSVVEAYDVRLDGVEQTFILSERPVGEGDLVVEGRIATPLTRVDEGGTGLTFADDHGNPLVRMGAAVAIDANGKSLAVSTTFADGITTLTLPSAAVREARFPLTIDPLVGRLGRTMLDTCARTDIASDDLSTTRSVMVALELVASATDHDLWIYLTAPDFANAVPILTLVDNTDLRAPSVAFVRGANRWVVAFTTSDQHVMGYVHSRENISLGSGGSPVVLTSNGDQPDVGGTRSQSVNQAIVVYRSTATGDATVRGVVLDALLKTHTLPFDLASTTAGNGLDRIHPSINQSASADGWIVAWEEVDTRPAFTRIVVNKARADRSIGVQSQVQIRDPNANYYDVMRPQLAGAAGRYLVTYLTSSTPNHDAGTGLRAVRFDWGAFDLMPTLIRDSVLGSATNGATLSALGLGFDHQTASHWCAIHRRSSLLASSAVVNRLGSTGGSVESVTIVSGGSGTSVSASAATFNGVDGDFPISYATNGSGAPVYVDRLAYSASIGIYGVSCGGSIAFPVAPNAGDEFFRVGLQGATGASSGALLIGFASANIPLTPYGFPGCSLWINPSPMVSLTTAVLAGGASVPIGLPDAPAFTGSLYFQWVTLGNGAPQISTTNAAQIQVR